MGTWGTKLYQNDLALDIKKSYIEKLKEGLLDEEALQQIKEKNEAELLDEDERSIFWIVLADTMWKVGRLTEEIKENAINSMDENLKIWKKQATPKDYEARKKELETIKERLQMQIPEKKKLTVNKKDIKKKTTKDSWEIGDIYAYQLKGEKAKENNINGRYLLLRKARETRPEEGRMQAVYCQITNDCKLPDTKEEIEKLDYVIMQNIGNVRYRYELEIYSLTKKTIKENFQYIGNYKSILPPYNEYSKNFYVGCNYKNLEEEVISRLNYFGTSSKPKRRNQKPEDMPDSEIRFLMREKYYEEVLNIIPPKGTYIQDDPLLFISLVDSMMIGGIVINPAGILDEKMKKKAYEKIEELKKIILEREDDEKNNKLKILEELEKNIKEFDYNVI